jgi:hypothetical protein
LQGVADAEGSPAAGKFGLAGCRVFGGALLKNVWPGVDIRLNGTDGIKYDLIVAPGTDPDVIRMRYEGQNELALKEGDRSHDESRARRIRR